MTYPRTPRDKDRDNDIEYLLFGWLKIRHYYALSESFFRRNSFYIHFIRPMFPKKAEKKEQKERIARMNKIYVADGARNFFFLRFQNVE